MSNKWYGIHTYSGLKISQAFPAGKSKPESEEFLKSYLPRLLLVEKGREKNVIGNFPRIYSRKYGTER
jgi:hypothetical protein